MAGRILNAANRESLAECLVAGIEESSSRRGLISLWRAGKIGLGDGKLLELITAACQDRQKQLDEKQTILLKAAERFRK